MIVMPANNTGIHVGYLAGKYPGRIGHLYGTRRPPGPFDYIPYALDNNRYIATTTGEEWDEKAYVETVERYTGHKLKPMWILVPDVVGDRDATLREWDVWAPRLEQYGVQLAMACQDGMTPEDVPEGIVAFLGGTTEWKRRNISVFCNAIDRVHVGRINTEAWLWVAHKSGAESVDGTGFFRGDQQQLGGLLRYLEWSTNGHPQREMFDDPARQDMRRAWSILKNHEWITMNHTEWEGMDHLLLLTIGYAATFVSRAQDDIDMATKSLTEGMSELPVIS